MCACVCVCEEETIIIMISGRSRGNLKIHDATG